MARTGGNENIIIPARALRFVTTCGSLDELVHVDMITAIRKTEELSIVRTVLDVLVRLSGDAPLGALVFLVGKRHEWTTAVATHAHIATLSLTSFIDTFWTFVDTQHECVQMTLVFVCLAPLFQFFSGNDFHDMA